MELKRSVLGAWVVGLGAALTACDEPPAGSGPTPATPPVVQADSAQPPRAVSGGTLLVTRDGKTAVAADPDRDRVWIVDLEARALRGQVALPAGDEPGRVVEDAAGQVHVVLRGGGAVATVDINERRLRGRRAVCPAPRGVAFDPATQMLHVACVGGELVTLPAGVLSGAEGQTTRRWLPTDLRDVLVWRGRVLVTRFRSGEILEVGAAGQTTRPLTLTDTSTHRAGVLWRVQPSPDGSLLALHQRADTTRLPVRTDWGGATTGGLTPANGLVTTVVSELPSGGGAARYSPHLSQSVLPVDLAISPTDRRVVVVAAGNVPGLGQPQILAYPAGALRLPAGELAQATAVPEASAINSASAVAFDGAGRLVIQAREPAALYVMPDRRPIVLSEESRYSVGQILFHASAGAPIACASCHPEAGDDGHTWAFVVDGDRRTLHLRGGVSASQPFHWDGAEPNMTVLMNQIFTQRMGGPPLTAAQVASLSRWLDAQPAIPPSPGPDADAILRGKALFDSPETACATCHSGPRLSDNRIVNVGTGGSFKVPPLVSIAARGPYMHNGCAATLRERFNPACGGTQHGSTARLSSAQLDDLVAYLETL